MVVIFDEPTLAEEAAMEAIATGGRGYNQQEMKAAQLSEGGWAVADTG